LPKWFGERPGKKSGDPETPDDEEEAGGEAPGREIKIKLFNIKYFNTFLIVVAEVEEEEEEEEEEAEEEEEEEE